MNEQKEMTDIKRQLEKRSKQQQMNSILSTSFNKPDKLAKGVINSIREMHERWNDGVKLKNINIAKEYINGQIGVLVEFNSKTSTKMHKPSSAIWPHANCCVFKCSQDLPIWISDFRMTNTGYANIWDKSIVLVDIVEKMQSVELFASTSFVCSETNKEFFRVMSGRFYSVTRGFVTLLGTTGWEIKLLVLCTSINPNDFPSSMIESSSKIMDDISQYQHNFGGYLFTEAHINDNITSIRIAVSDKCMWVSLNKPIESTLQITDVFIGPF
ncbi:MAG: hypothetical protein H6Q73_3811 [Firmicutes bacterium]|nr:hypothetical protein [Bacillota bacterium]